MDEADCDCLCRRIGPHADLVHLVHRVDCIRIQKASRPNRTEGLDMVPTRLVGLEMEMPILLNAV